MNPLYLILVIFIALFATGFFSVDQKDSSQLDTISATKLTYTITNPCRPEVEMGRETVERFLTLSRHEGKRTETGTINLRVSQITLLDKKEYPEACRYLNKLNEETINAHRNGDGNSPAFDIVYYKGKDFYFVVIVPAPPSDPDVVQTGYTGLIIYDQNLNRIVGYSSV